MTFLTADVTFDTGRFLCILVSIPVSFIEDTLMNIDHTRVIDAIYVALMVPDPLYIKGG